MDSKKLYVTAIIPPLNGDSRISAEGTIGAEFEEFFLDSKDGKKCLIEVETSKTLDEVIKDYGRSYI